MFVVLTEQSVIHARSYTELTPTALFRASCEC